MTDLPRNPAESLRVLARQWGVQHGLEVDEEVFDRAAAYYDELVEVPRGYGMTRATSGRRCGYCRWSTEAHHPDCPERPR